MKNLDGNSWQIKIHISIHEYLVIRNLARAARNRPSILVKLMHSSIFLSRNKRI